MASEPDQTLPPLPAPSNPNQIHHTPTAPLLPLPLPLPEQSSDPTPPAARKLPIKRRSPPRPSSSPASSSGPASSDPAALKHGQHSPAFKFQRIWSESDELRFLQGLLGCGAQGLVFPRDLNIFYDRFSESMPQPYTRSQLSEKLRRLKNKHRSVSTRVARGLDPARLAPHDRDVLHLCSRLWDPANAATSPFAAAAAGTGGSSSGNKRRRANPQGDVAPLDIPAPSGDSYNGISSSAFPDENGEDAIYLEQESGQLYFDDGAAAMVADCNLVDGIPMEQGQTMAAAFTNIADNGLAAFTTTADNGLAAFTNIADNGAASDVPNIVGNNTTMIVGNNNMVDNGNGNCQVMLPRSNEHRLASSVLDIFEDCVREAKTACDANAEESEHAKRWRQQRIDELDVLSRRLRLLVEDATAAGQ